MNTTQEIPLVKIWTDGSARKNGQKGAFGSYAYIIVAPDGQELEEWGVEEGATNQQMELMGAIQALEIATKAFPNVRIKLYSDSAYLVNCWKDHWYRNWMQNGWKNSKKEPVANQGLWERLVPFFMNPSIQFIKVKGHSGDPMNERVDTLAQKASIK